MKLLKRISLIFLIVIIVILIVAVFFTKKLAKSGLPDYNQEVKLTGLLEPVTVYRDSLAIPHIYARNQHDLYMATGYLMAQDRLWQMDLLRRVTLGRLSEIFGNDFIKTDLLLRSLRFSEKSKTLFEISDPEIQEAVSAFSEGINQFIMDNEDNFPIEFTLLGYQPDLWEPLHTFNLIGYMAWDLKAGWSELVLEDIAGKVDSASLSELLPDPLKQKTYVYENYKESLLAVNSLLQLTHLEEMGLDIFSGSNNWAVAGSKTTTGMPLVANDMHLGFGIPGIWIQMHQVIEGELNVSGLVLPGQPFVIVGHNDSIVWGMTNTYVDNLDFYEEEVHPEDSNKYLFNGVWEDFIVRDELIKSKDGSEHQLSYRMNHRGPVVSQIKGITDRVLTIHWVGDEESNELRSIYLVNRANNLDDFKTAFKSFKSISQNVVYADRKGNIGLFTCAGVPIRKRDKVFAVLPGTSDEYDWQGMVPFDSLSYEYNPERGYVSSANNRTVDDSYPYHIGSWFDIPYRIDRIREMLDSKEIFSINDFIEMQNDQKSKYSELFLTQMLPILKTDENFNETELKALELLESWDFDLSTSSLAATISEFWAANLMEEIYKDEMGEEIYDKFIGISTLTRNAFYSFMLTKNSNWLNDVTTDEKESLENILSISYKRTIDDLQAEFGTDISTWTWGTKHTFTLEHPIAKVEALDKVFKLNRGPYAVGGSFHTVSPYKYRPSDPGTIYHGSSHRSIYDVNNWGNSISVIPTGTSGIPSSEFYCDQTELYVNGEYHPDYFERKAVEDNARFVMEFKPEPFP